MNSWIVIDSGVLISSVVQEAYSDKATALLEWIEQEHLHIVAPTLLRYEVAATLRKLAHRATISSEDGERLLKQVLKTPIELIIDTALIERAYQIATEHNLSTAYDAQYLAVAERFDCVF